MSKAWQYPVWHPGDCDGTPLCPPRCPRYITDDGVAVTVYADDAGQLVAVDDGGTPLAGATIADGVAQLEVIDGADTVGAEVLRQIVARAHERGENRLTVEAAEEVIELVVSEFGEAVCARDPGRLVLAPDHSAASH